MRSMPNTNKGVMICIFFVFVLLQCGFFFGKDPVKTVQDGILDIDNSTTVRDALNGYRLFKSNSWKSFTGDQNRSIVQFTGVIDIEKYLKQLSDSGVNNMFTYEYMTEVGSPIYSDKFAFIAQFILQKDGDGFRVGYIGYEIDGERVDGTFQDLNVIYANNIPEKKIQLVTLCDQYIVTRMLDEFCNSAVGEYSGVFNRPINVQNPPIEGEATFKIIKFGKKELLCDIRIEKKVYGVFTAFERHNVQMEGRIRIEYGKIVPVFQYVENGNSSGDNRHVIMAQVFGYEKGKTVKYDIDGFILSGLGEEISMTKKK